jgi:hypothetical protein
MVTTYFMALSLKLLYFMIESTIIAAADAANHDAHRRPKATRESDRQSNYKCGKLSKKSRTQSHITPLTSSFVRVYLASFSFACVDAELVAESAVTNKRPTI